MYQIKNTFLQSIVLLLLVVVMVACDQNEKIDLPNSFLTKLSDNSPLELTTPESQYFEISGGSTQVIEGDNGVRVSIPKGAFLDQNGKAVTTNIKVELQEITTVDNMLLSGISTTSNGELLETGGMIYIDATVSGKQLTIDPKAPVYVEIPTVEIKDGMQLYEGEVVNGTINWVNPTPLEKFLVSVDLSELDFYPEGFEDKLKMNLPFAGHEKVDTKLLDSVFYSLSGVDMATINTQITMANDEVEVRESLDEYAKQGTAVEEVISDSASNPVKNNCCIDPANIKVLKSDKFQNTMISTREFEKRLKAIYKTCNSEVLSIYTDNLDKKLFELDSMVVMLLGEHRMTNTFLDFYKEKRGRVNNSDVNALALKNYLKEQRQKVKKEINAARKEMLAEQKQKKLEIARVSKKYKRLLQKRERYRMRSYGFKVTSTGYKNVDRGTQPKWWGQKKLEVIVHRDTTGVQNPIQSVFTYIVYDTIKSLYKMRSSDLRLFQVGSENRPTTLMPKNKKATIISIGYTEDEILFGRTEFIPNQSESLKMTISKIKKAALQDSLKEFNSFKKRNRIDKDLEFSLKIENYNRYAKGLQKDIKTYTKLWSKLNYCCNGEALFKAYCSSCHRSYDRVLIGPSLFGATKKHSMDWLIKWTRDSQEFLASGDIKANEIFNKYNKSVQTAMDLTDQEIINIYKYIDELNSNSLDY